MRYIFETPKGSEIGKIKVEMPQHFISQIPHKL